MPPAYGLFRQPMQGAFFLQTLLPVECNKEVTGAVMSCMTLGFALHMFLHVAVPLSVAAIFYRTDFQRAALLLLAGILIDADHLLADPILNPERCSVGFHLLHNYWLILFYTLLALIPRTRLIGLGLVIHIGLDWLDCLL